MLILYDDDGTDKGLFLHPTATHVAVSGTCNPTGSVVLVATTLDQALNNNASLSVSKITVHRVYET